MIPRWRPTDALARDVWSVMKFCLDRRIKHADVREACWTLFHSPDHAALCVLMDAIERRGMFPVHVARSIARLKAALDAGATWRFV